MKIKGLKRRAHVSLGFRSHTREGRTETEPERERDREKEGERGGERGREERERERERESRANVHYICTYARARASELKR